MWDGVCPTLSHMRDIPLILLCGLSAACSGSIFGLAPTPTVAGPAVSELAIESASAAVGLATATGSLNALAASSPARTIDRGETEIVSLPERTVVREVAAPRPSRTLVAVNATAGPPDEDREVVLAAAPASSSGERWAIPMEEPRITSQFGPRIDPITGQRGRMHRGTDFGAVTGTPVYATASGEVVLGGWCDGGTGNCVVIDHAAGWRSQYFHLSDVDVRSGERVEQGQKIGEVGSTGRSTGPHLHFQLGRGSEAVDAEGLFGRRIE